MKIIDKTYRTNVGMANLVVAGAIGSLTVAGEMLVKYLVEAADCLDTDEPASRSDLENTIRELTEKLHHLARELDAPAITHLDVAGVRQVANQRGNEARQGRAWLDAGRKAIADALTETSLLRSEAEAAGLGLVENLIAYLFASFDAAFMVALGKTPRPLPKRPTIVPTFPAEARKECALWQLANDTVEYGDKATHWILVTPDGEDEIDCPFDPRSSEEGAREEARLLGYTVVPLCIPAARR